MLYIGFSIVWVCILAYMLCFWLWPEVVGGIVRCPLKTVFGVECPSCGLTRAYMHLFAGDWRGALALNKLLIPTALAGVAFPLIVLSDLLLGTRCLPRLCHPFHPASP